MSKTVYDSYWLNVAEPVARKIAMDHYGLYGWVVKNNPNIYKVDQLLHNMTDNTPDVHLELESFKNFRDGIYHSPKHHAVTIPIRKHKLFIEGVDCYWMCFSIDFTHYIVLPGDEILNSKVIEYKVYNNIFKEKFYKYTKYPPEELVHKFNPKIIEINQHLITIALKEAVKAKII